MSIVHASNTLISNADMSASFYSDSIQLTKKISYSMHAIFTGAPVGSLYIAISIDGIDWTVLPNSTTAISAAGDVFFNITQVGYLYARLHYAFTSGTGTLNAYYSTKGE